ncbi:hypothetical protein [Leisingera sp.]|uniref:hypothetical protein n=1 Tax=Leisingera sp. TaxID=1879318 RepID=UPI002B26CA22|nr:hypothetical protein [Leisingera sp.]
MIRQGKHAQATGGGTGNRLAIAQTLAAEGVQIAITGRSKKDVSVKSGGVLWLSGPGPVNGQCTEVTGRQT